MPSKYKDIIENYCNENRIVIPPGFYRHSASRYAVVDMELTPPKLIATTWFKKEDVAYYLLNISQGKRMRVLDFKDRCELLFEGNRFSKGDVF